MCALLNCRSFSRCSSTDVRRYRAALLSALLSAEEDTPMAGRHTLFSADEWAEIDRVTNRWSAAGRAKDELLATSPVDGDKLHLAFGELSAAAADYHKTLDRILGALHAQRPQ
jgi:hypothetical protein